MNKSAISSNFQNGGHIRRNTALKLYNSAVVGFSSNYYAFNFIDSKGAGSSSAVIKNNYIARVASKNITNPATGLANGAGTFDATTFSADNTIENAADKVDISATFTGLDGATAVDIKNPAGNFVPAAGSVMLTGSITDVNALGS